MESQYVPPSAVKNGGPGNSLAVRNQSTDLAMPFDPAWLEWMANRPQERPMSFRDYLRIIFRQKNVIFMTILAVLSTVYVGLKLQTPVYEAGVKMLILAAKQVEAPYYRDLEGGLKSELTITQSEIVRSNPVLERTVKALKLDERPLDYEKEFSSPLKAALIDIRTQAIRDQIKSPEQERILRFKAALESLKKNIRVKPVNNTNLFTIIVRDNSPIAAAIIANTVSRYYVIFDLEQQLAELQIKYGPKHLAVRQLRDFIAQMERELSGTPTSYVDAMGPASVKILEQATMPTDSVGTSKSLVFAAGVVSAILLGIALAFLCEFADPTFRSPEDVQKALGVPMLGSIPRRSMGAKILTREPKWAGRYGQSFQSLADHFHILMKNEGLQVFMLTSTRSGEGVSTVATNVATYLSSNLGHRTLLIDANLRKPSLHKAFKVADTVGLADVLEGRTPLETAAWEIGPNLAVIPAGRTKSNPVTLLGSKRMVEALQTARERYDAVLIDCSSLKNSKESEVLADVADAMVLIIEASRSRRHAVKAALSTLEQKRARTVGAVLNKRDFAIPTVIYERV